MGPRLFRRGNAFDGVGNVFLSVASMGPRLFRRGNGSVCSNNNYRFSASMGPRLFRRGNKDQCIRITIDIELQWGHVFSDVETSEARQESDVH